MDLKNEVPDGAEFIGHLSSFLPSAVKQQLIYIHSLYVWSMKQRDRRVDGWPLLDSPLPTLLLTAGYLLLVWLGPRLMRHRQPMQLRAPLVLYNLAVSLLNLYIGLELAMVAWKQGYSWLCEPVDYSTSPEAMRITSALWFYYISKLLEFADTAFFVLRKKNGQITFLHVYHHSTMFLLWWIGMRWVAGGSAFVGAMLNSFVHVLMYLYYGLSAIGPRLQPYLWWKKYLTMLQLLQFFVALVLGVNALRLDCPFPLWMQYTLVIYMISFILLFLNFYIHAYSTGKARSARAQNGVDPPSERKNTTNGFTDLRHKNGYHRVASGGDGGRPKQL
ncbi:Elongation of very long chain fatty acids protein 4 [Amphibalanus amphitrite]|uniref:Elongation of very long chain fatty acids protein n=1 Tax=Amphibalanus amphitrite TaxID=1232801 RepID=A0A6A4WNV9_AMPAM|nr:elongation of very long chain fatty acids protein 4-like [Amphibalanus amphitrite]XP_043189371.1 elongation of very long chain fatty acids protein 4-like [Amphibalanus amphitrite]XP_043189372.1 elongation of very long chain fatty acids protein 4-like [Amphibalanus amphitrite]KAF0303631.1 Elongation of very long chain fatty acids protein 4 [Amphibalanus amphitrite]